MIFFHCSAVLCGYVKGLIVIVIVGYVKVVIIIVGYVDIDLVQSEDVSGAGGLRLLFDAFFSTVWVSLMRTENAVFSPIMAQKSLYGMATGGWEVAGAKFMPRKIDNVSKP